MVFNMLPAWGCIPRMFRLGMCSGRIYTSDEYNGNDIEECCVLVTHGTPIENEKYIKMIREQNKHKCARCGACPEFKKVR